MSAGTSQQVNGNITDDKLKQSQRQVKEITNIMQQNIEKALQRDVNLAQLEQSADSLQINADDFKRTSTKTKKKFLWKNRKWTIVLIVVILLILLILALGIYFGFSKR